MLFSADSNHSLPLRAEYFLQHPVLMHFRSVFFPPYDTPYFIHLQSTTYVFLLFEKRKEKQKLTNGTAPNIPRFSSVNNSFMRAILNFQRRS
jgi:hypothetical protein